MGHDHHHTHTRDNEAIVGRAFVLIAGFMVVEVIGGLLANSLTLLADAGHMFLDATALGLSWYALRLSKRSNDHKLSYGYHRFQVLAAFINGLTLMGLVVWILVEAYGRLRAPEGMLALPALAVAAVGMVVNLIAFRWLHGAEDNATVRSAALHVIGDLLGSAAAIIAALTVYLTGWLYADPLLAIVIVVILGRGAWRVLKESAHILLEGVPHGINLKEIAETLAARVPGVIEVHHVHAWALTSEKPLVTLHASVDEGTELAGVVSHMKVVLNDDFGIDHSTIQVEHGPCPDDD
ncbi:MAG: cation transporter [Gammaproteobacteria bacterium]|nr:MAG: cation transporter [Gammaproteobacteria bacterium]